MKTESWGTSADALEQEKVFPVIQKLAKKAIVKCVETFNCYMIMGLIYFSDRCTFLNMKMNEIDGHNSHFYRYLVDLVDSFV